MVISSLQIQHSIATETLGPLDKYVAANDNKEDVWNEGFGLPRTTLRVPMPSVSPPKPPQDESGQSAGFGIGAASIRGPIGSGKPYLYTAKELAEMEPDPLHTIEDLAKLPGFIYLGSPYAKYHAGMDEAARVVTECAGKLMARGMRIYCPIAHGHAVTRYQELPRTWSYWKNQDQPLIDAASSLIVLEMHGWWQSVGLEYEFGAFMKAGKPIVYVEPSELGVEEPKMGRA